MLWEDWSSFSHLKFTGTGEHEWWEFWTADGWHCFKWTRIPHDRIREYFGEQIGLYFAWLELYTVRAPPQALISIY